MRDVEEMYLSTLGRRRPRKEGIPSDGFDSEESEADVGRIVSTSKTHQESKCSDERGESRVVRKSVKKRRKDNLPVVRTRESGPEVTGSGSSNVETSNSRVSSRNKFPGPHSREWQESMDVENQALNDDER